jgi:hypothetical protein
MTRSRSRRTAIPASVPFREAQKTFMEARWTFITTEIMAAKAFLGAARTQLTMGKMERADALLRKARTAHLEASSILDAPRFARLASSGKLRSDLKSVAEAIADLQRERNSNSND